MRSKVETRGRRRSLTQIYLRALDATRNRLLKKADDECEILWDDIIAAARTPAIDRTTKLLDLCSRCSFKSRKPGRSGAHDNRGLGPTGCPSGAPTVPDQSPTSPRPVPDTVPDTVPDGNLQFFNDF